DTEAVQVLRHVVAAGAGTDDDGALANVLRALPVLLGVDDIPAEVVKSGDVGHSRDSGDPSRHHHVAWMHDAPRAVSTLEWYVPPLLYLVVLAAAELGPSPDVDLHRLGVELEPVPQLVLWHVHRPGVGEGEIRQVVDP